MVRRTKFETKISHERWLVSYADFITLLFAFFVVMYSVSQVNESKYKVLSNTLEEVFSASKIDEIEDRLQTENNVAQLDELQEELQESLAGLIDEGDVVLSGNEQWVDIQLNANILFNTGKADPSEEAKKVFAEVAQILSPYENGVAVIGHTDDVPIRNAEFDSNWELSSSRAVSIVTLLAFQGVAPQRMSAVGYGEYQPIADNTTAEGRAKNRRVVLRVAKAAAPSAKETASQAVGSSEVEPNQNGEQQEDATETQNIQENQDDEDRIQPVKLRGGGLLFSSDPDLPRNNPPAQEPAQ